MLQQILFAFQRNEKATKKGTLAIKEMKRDLATLRKTVEMHEARLIRTDSKIMGIEKRLSEGVGIMKELIEDMKKTGSGFSSGGSSFGDSSTAPTAGGGRLPPKG